jgi:hypothetical protein
MTTEVQTPLTDVTTTGPAIVTVSNGLSKMMTWAMIAGGGLFYAFAVALVVILWQGGWAPSTQVQVIEIFGKSGLGLLALAVGGPVGKFKLDTKLGSAEIDGDR